MVKINWKKSAIVALDIAIGGYLLLAVTAFNRPAEKATVCSEVRINIGNASANGFLSEDGIRRMLDRQGLYPVGKQMSDISARAIEEAVRKSPFVDQAECYKTLSGHVCINLQQRMPVVHVMAQNGDNYYVDTQGSIMPETRAASDLIVATGAISRRFAQKQLTAMANMIAGDRFWQSQVEQIHVLNDGTVELVPRVGDHIIYLGPPVDVNKKLERLRKFYQYGLTEAGWNRYSRISVEFSNQIICKKRELKGKK